MELLELLELQAKLEKLKLSRDAEDAERVRDAATRGVPLDDMETQPWQFQMEPLKVHRASFGLFVFARTLFGSSRAEIAGTCAGGATCKCPQGLAAVRFGTTMN